jgi:hypothetical protein
MGDPGLVESNWKLPPEPDGYGLGAKWARGYSCPAGLRLGALQRPEGREDGGRCKVRTCDPCRVKAVLYR